VPAGEVFGSQRAAVCLHVVADAFGDWPR
jgi:hypothetical protein